MPPRGEKKAGGRPRLESKGQAPRVHISCRISSDSSEFLQEHRHLTGNKIGALLDVAIATLKQHPENLPAPQSEDNDAE